MEPRLDELEARGDLGVRQRIRRSPSSARFKTNDEPHREAIDKTHGATLGDSDGKISSFDVTSPLAIDEFSSLVASNRRIFVGRPMLTCRSLLPSVFALTACAAAPAPAERTTPVVIAAPATSAPLPLATAEPAPPAEPQEPEPAASTEPQTSAPSPWLAGEAAPSTITLAAGALVLPEPIRFETGKPTLHASSEKLLDDIAAFLRSKPEISALRIEGHSDDRGSADFNLKLTGERALTVARALVQRGISCKRLFPVGFGELRPIVSNTTPENRAKNRRIDLVIAALSGKPIGGRPVDGGGTISGDPCR